MIMRFCRALVSAYAAVSLLSGCAEGTRVTAPGTNPFARSASGRQPSAANVVIRPKVIRSSQTIQCPRDSTHWWACVGISPTSAATIYFEICGTLSDHAPFTLSTDAHPTKIKNGKAMKRIWTTVYPYAYGGGEWANVITTTKNVKKGQRIAKYEEILEYYCYYEGQVYTGTIPVAIGLEPSSK